MKDYKGRLQLVMAPATQPDTMIHRFPPAAGLFKAPDRVPGNEPAPVPPRGFYPPAPYIY